MKFLVAVTIALGLVALPATAQHGASHGGFSGHSAGMSHSAPMGHAAPMSPMGHGAPAPHFAPPMTHPAPVTRFNPPMSHPAPVGRFAPPLSHPAPVARFGPAGPGAHPGPMRFGGSTPVHQGPRAPYTGGDHRSGHGNGWGNHDHGHDGDGDHHRHPYYRGWGLNYSYVYPGWWPGYPFLLSACILGCDASDFNSYGYGSGYGPGFADAATYGQYEPQPAASAMSYPGYPAAPSTYESQSSQAYTQPQPDDPPESRPAYAGQNISSPPQPALQVILKDGQQLQVHNYLLTSTALTVLDNSYRQIPIDQIDINATRQTNLANGLDFRVPRAAPANGKVRPGAATPENTPSHNQISALSPQG
ncbi:hypothetical protein DYQ86_26040 [Acidobacteria bacterium AB60]|nr:hypothetical protein DYQ86_26040 [Acidobacteria bacterium AB60]